MDIKYRIQFYRFTGRVASVEDGEKLRRKKSKKKDSVGSISLGETVKVKTVTTYKSFIWVYFLQVFLIWFGMYIPIVCFTSSFDISYRKDAILLTSILSAVFYWLLFYFYRFLKYTIPITSLALIYLVIKYKNYLKNGFYYLENAIIDKMNYYFNMSVVKYKVEFSRELCITLFLVVVLQVFGILAALLIVRTVRKSVYIFVSSLFVFSGFFVGVVPNPIAFVFYIIFIYTISSMDINIFRKKMELKRRETRILDTKVDYKQIVRLKVGLVVGTLLCLITILVMIVFTPETYEKHVNFTVTKNKIQSKLLNFSFEEFLNDMNKRFQGISLFENKEIFKGGAMGGGLAGGKLSTDPYVEFTNKTVFQLTIPRDAGSLYLKGFAGANYTGESWEGLHDSERKQYDEIVENYGDGSITGDNLTSKYLRLLSDGVVAYERDKLLSFGKSPNGIWKRLEMDIKYVAANERYMYAPYFLGNLPEGEFTFESDLYIKPKKERDEYSYMFYDLSDGVYINENLNKLIDLQKSIVIKDVERYNRFSIFEENYRKFVYNTYAGIPVNQFKQIEGIDLGVSKAYDVDSMIEVVKSVIKYLENTTRYTLSPGALPDGKDYIEYFLFDSKQGYCAHYASAAVMILRYYGVPARYVEGYIVTDRDIRNGSEGKKLYPQVTYNESGEELWYQATKTNVEIRDTNAHAWVEIYLDGVGWVPVEVTAGYSAGGIESLNESIQNEVEHIPTTSPMPTKQPKPTPTLIPETIEEETLIPSVSNAPSKDTNDIDPNKALKEEQTLRDVSAFDLLNTVNLFIGSTIIMLLFIYIRYHVLRYLSETKKTDVFHRNEAALFLYSQLEEMIKILRIRKKEDETYEEFFKRVESRYAGLPEGYEETLTLLRKARFSGQSIRKEEYDKVLSYYNEFRDVFYRQFNKIHQFYLKYWKIF